MPELGRILIADDEETFLYSTADLLRREGYDCDCVPDAGTCMQKLKHNRYDLLIADIKMPGNPELELISDLPRVAEGMPAILVTGYPSRHSAIQAVQLPVVAYLVKPVDFDELLTKVRAAVGKSRMYQAVVATAKHLQHWTDRIADMEQNLRKKTGSTPPAFVGDFIDLNYANMQEILAQTKRMIAKMPPEDVDLLTCPIANCRKIRQLTAVIEQTIEVLEKTKGAFKSKELGALRKKLEKILKKQKKMMQNNETSDRMRGCGSQ